MTKICCKSTAPLKPVKSPLVGIFKGFHPLFRGFPEASRRKVLKLFL